MSDCEWDPDTNSPALGDKVGHGIATLVVGTGKNDFHLCAACAALPRFKRMKKRPLPLGVIR